MIKPISYLETYSIRHEVMWPDKEMSYIHVEGDEEAEHFGYFLDGILVSVISVFRVNESYQFRKFATLIEFQGQGIGSKLLAYIMDTYKGTIFCNARIEKTDFYKRFDLKETNNQFIRGGKSYIVMKRIQQS